MIEKSPRNHMAEKKNLSVAAQEHPHIYIHMHTPNKQMFTKGEMRLKKAALGRGLA